MRLYNWYTFENYEHTYGYLLFFPIKIEERRFGEHIYGIGITCSDSGEWNSISIGSLNSVLAQDAIDYYDSFGNQPGRREVIKVVWEDEIPLKYQSIE